MLFEHYGESVFRFDPQCMSPANPAAELVLEFLPQLLFRAAKPLSWEKDTVLAIANWRVLHGRGHPPLDESMRELQRIYVK